VVFCKTRLPVHVSGFGAVYGPGLPGTSRLFELVCLGKIQEVSRSLLEEEVRSCSLKACYPSTFCQPWASYFWSTSFPQKLALMSGSATTGAADTRQFLPFAGPARLRTLNQCFVAVFPLSKEMIRDRQVALQLGWFKSIHASHVDDATTQRVSKEQLVHQQGLDTGCSPLLSCHERQC